MTGSAKRKGDKAELELCGQLRELTGWPVTRRLGAGRREDAGDLVGIPDCTAQVKNYADVTRGVREALNVVEDQQRNGATTFGVAFVRRPGARWIAVQTLPQWATSHREATGDDSDRWRALCHRVIVELENSPGIANLAPVAAILVQLREAIWENV